MASQWVGVVGTGIGASIGGVVTVASLRIKGKQETTARREAAAREDRLRSEDRAWQLHQQNVGERRALYRDLLRRADEVGSALSLLAETDDADESDEARNMLDGRLTHFAEVQADAVVVAHDVTVADLSHRLRDAANLAVMAYDAGDYGVSAEQSPKVEDLLVKLKAACRRDLGHDAGGDPEQPAR